MQTLYPITGRQNLLDCVALAIIQLRAALCVSVGFWKPHDGLDGVAAILQARDCLTLHRNHLRGCKLAPGCVLRLFGCQKLTARDASVEVLSYLRVGNVTHTTA